jgi:hypothetical protein
MWTSPPHPGDYCGRLQGLKVAVVEGHDIGGTCVNRGCVPSKALLAASGRVRELQNTMHLKSLGIQVGSVSYERQPIADHATNLANTIQGNLKRSLEAIGVVSCHTLHWSALALECQMLCVGQAWRPLLLTQRLCGPQCGISAHNIREKELSRIN